jgi:hypothetical protein
MMQAAEKAARAAMLEAAQREGISLGPWSANTRHQLDDQQLQFINELEQSSSNGEISGGDQHLLQEVMGLHQGQVNFQIEPVQETAASTPQSYYRQMQPAVESQYPQQQLTDELMRYNNGMQQIPQDYFQQFLLHQQQFDENSFVQEDTVPSLPEEHYLTIAQNGKKASLRTSMLESLYEFFLFDYSFQARFLRPHGL